MFQRIARLAASSLRYSADLILPPVCVSCGTLTTHHNLLCPKCWANLYLITPPLCDRLGIPLPGYEGDAPHISVQAVANPPVFSRARAAAHYSGIMRRLIVRFKFEDKHEPLPLFVRLMREAGRELLDGADLMAPVPLHRLRLLQRRFNQSALLAKGLSRATGVPVEVMALRRTRRTEAQVGLDQEARQENVAKAFGVHPRRQKFIAGKRIVLIDDVITTGSTANACASALLAAGAAQVDLLAIALVAHGLGAPEAEDFMGRSAGIGPASSEWHDKREKCGPNGKAGCPSAQAARRKTKPRRKDGVRRRCGGARRPPLSQAEFVGSIGEGLVTAAADVIVHAELDGIPP